MSRHLRYENGEWSECAPDVSWVTVEQVPAPIVWPWWLAVPAGWLRRKMRF